MILSVVPIITDNVDDVEKENFVFWRYYIDIEPKKQIDQSDYIDQIAKLLKDLNSNKRRCSYSIKVVASCDFEEDLNMNCFNKNSNLYM